jgi:hypothetical protein
MLEKFVVIEKTKEHLRLKLAKHNQLKTLLGNPLSNIHQQSQRGFASCCHGWMYTSHSNTTTNSNIFDD